MLIFSYRKLFNSIGSIISLNEYMAQKAMNLSFIALGYKIKAAHLLLDQYVAPSYQLAPTIGAIPTPTLLPLHRLLTLAPCEGQSILLLLLFLSERFRPCNIMNNNYEYIFFCFQVLSYVSKYINNINIYLHTTFCLLLKSNEIPHKIFIDILSRIASISC